MSLTVAYAALATGIIVWLVLVTRFRAKPWERQVAATPEGANALPFSPKRVGLWVFLAVVTSLFCLFLSAYYMRMGQHAGHGDRRCRPEGDGNGEGPADDPERRRRGRDDTFHG